MLPEKPIAASIDPATPIQSVAAELKKNNEEHASDPSVQKKYMNCFFLPEKSAIEESNGLINAITKKASEME